MTTSLRFPLFVLLSAFAGTASAQEAPVDFGKHLGGLCGGAGGSKYTKRIENPATARKILDSFKAGKGWTGKVAEVTTTEYIDGTPRKVVAKFRAYDSYEDSFRDYARLINNNPRYEKARAQTDSATAYATELQKALTLIEQRKALGGIFQQPL